MDNHVCSYSFLRAVALIKECQFVFIINTHLKQPGGEEGTNWLLVQLTVIEIRYFLDLVFGSRLFVKR